MSQVELKKAIQLNQSGEKQQAREILEDIVAENPENLAAWFWLVDSVETNRERVEILRQAQMYHPEDSQIQKAFRKFSDGLASEERFFAMLQSKDADLVNPKESSLPESTTIQPVVIDVKAVYAAEEKTESANPVESFEEEASEIPPVNQSVGATAWASEVKEESSQTKLKSEKAKKSRKEKETEKTAQHQRKTKTGADTANSSPSKGRKKTNPKLFTLILSLSIVVLVAAAVIWQLRGQIPWFTAAITPTSEIYLIPDETMTLTSESPDLTQTPEPTQEETLLPTETSVVAAGETSPTPILAATITPTPSVAEGLFFPINGSRINDFAWSSDGSYFALAGETGISLFNGRTFSPLLTISTDPMLPVRSLVMSEDERLIAAGFDFSASAEEFTSRAKMWNINDGAELLSFNYSQDRGDIDHLAFSLDGQILWTNAIYDQLVQWNAVDGSLLNVFEFSNSKVDYYNTAFAPDRRSVAVFSLYDRLKIYDSATGERTATLGDNKMITGVAWSPNSQYLAVSYDNSSRVHVWDIPAGLEYRIIDTNAGTVTAMAINPYSRVLAIATRDNLIKLVDIQTGEELRVISRQIPDVTQIHFSPDGTLIAMRNQENVQAWNLQTDVLVASFRAAP